MKTRKAPTCRDCWSPAQVDYLGLCESCASVPEIVEEKKRAQQVTQEIRNGMPGFYAELRGAKDGQ